MNVNEDELTVNGVPLSNVDREASLPFILVPVFYCPNCGRILQLDLSDTENGVIRVRGCGDQHNPDHWYKVKIGESGLLGVQLADRDWRT